MRFEIPPEVKTSLMPSSKGGLDRKVAGRCLGVRSPSFRGTIAIDDAISAVSR